MIFNKNNKYITLLLSLILVPVRAEGDPPTLPSDHKDGATLEATTQTAAVPVVKRRRSDSSCLPTKPPTARTTHPPSRAAVLQKQIDTMTMELAGLQDRLAASERRHVEDQKRIEELAQLFEQERLKRHRVMRLDHSQRSMIEALSGRTSWQQDQIDYLRSILARIQGGLFIIGPVVVIFLFRSGKKA